MPGMMAKTLVQCESISVVDYRCTAGRGDAPFPEVHQGFNAAYVRKGSFGYRANGRSFELVAGAVLVGHPGDEYTCTHDHAASDECLSFRLSAGLADSLGGSPGLWRVGRIPPIPELMVLGELAQAAAEGRPTSPWTRRAPPSPPGWWRPLPDGRDRRPVSGDEIAAVP